MQRAERLSGYHDPGSPDQEGPASVESRYGFVVIRDGHRQHCDSFTQFATRVIDAYATEESDVQTGVVTDAEGSVRDLTERERRATLDYTLRLIAGVSEGGE